MPERERVTPRSRLLCCLAAAAVALAAIPASAQAGPRDVREANARPNHFQSAKGAVVYVPTRATVMDAKTHSLRKLTPAEVDELMVTIKPLASQPQPRPAAKGANRSLNLDGRTDFVVLARPNADGTFETRCISTFPEAVEFLGLKAVAADSPAAKRFLTDERH